MTFDKILIVLFWVIYSFLWIFSFTKYEEGVSGVHTHRCVIEPKWSNLRKFTIYANLTFSIIFIFYIFGVAIDEIAGRESIEWSNYLFIVEVVIPLSISLVFNLVLVFYEDITSFLSDLFYDINQKRKNKKKEKNISKNISKNDYESSIYGKGR